MTGLLPPATRNTRSYDTGSYHGAVLLVLRTGVGTVRLLLPST